MVETGDLRPLCLSNRTPNLLQCDNGDESASQIPTDPKKNHYMSGYLKPRPPCLYRGSAARL